MRRLVSYSSALTIKKGDLLVAEFHWPLSGELLALFSSNF